MRDTKNDHMEVKTRLESGVGDFSVLRDGLGLGALLRSRRGCGSVGCSLGIGSRCLVRIGVALLLACRHVVLGLDAVDVLVVDLCWLDGLGLGVLLCDLCPGDEA